MSPLSIVECNVSAMLKRKYSKSINLPCYHEDMALYSEYQSYTDNKEFVDILYSHISLLIIILNKMRTASVREKFNKQVITNMDIIQVA